MQRRQRARSGATAGSCPSPRPRRPAASRWTSGTAKHDRSRASGRHSETLPQTADPRGQRRSRALDAAPGRRNALRSAGRADLERPICPFSPAHTGTCVSPGTTRTAAACRCPAHVFARVTGGLAPISETVHRPVVRAAAERTGPQPLSVQLPARGCRSSRSYLDVAHRPRVSCARRSSESRFAGTEAAPVVLGSGTLVRVLRAGATAESLRVRIAPPAEPELDLIVEDGNNPPLDLRKVSAVFAELPWIYFEASSPPSWRDTATGGCGADATISRRRGPSIDLSRTPDGPMGGRAPAARRLRAKAVPLQQSAPARPSKASFAIRGRLPPRTIAGLVALPLDAAVLEPQPAGPRRVSPTFGSLTEQQAGAVSARAPRRAACRRPDARLGGRASDAAAAAGEWWQPVGVSHCAARSRICLPGSLTVETSARVFHRSVQVGVVRPADREQARSVVRCAAVDDVEARRRAGCRSGAHALAGPRWMQTELWLVVDEGDNAPLPLDRARLLLPSYRLRFFAPPGRRAAARLRPGGSSAAALRSVAARAESHGRVRDGGDGRSRIVACRTPTPFISPRWFWVLLGVRR